MFGKKTPPRVLPPDTIVIPKGAKLRTRDMHQTIHPIRQAVRDITLTDLAQMTEQELHQNSHSDGMFEEPIYPGHYIVRHSQFVGIEYLIDWVYDEV